MVESVVPFHLTHNAEAEAIDLLIEVQRLKFLLTLDKIDEKNYQRICLYLIKAADFMVDPEDLVVRFELIGWYSTRLLRSRPFTLELISFTRKCSRLRSKSLKSKSSIMMLSASHFVCTEQI